MEFFISALSNNFGGNLKKLCMVAPCIILAETPVGAKSTHPFNLKDRCSIMYDLPLPALPVMKRTELSPSFF